MEKERKSAARMCSLASSSSWTSWRRTIEVMFGCGEGTVRSTRHISIRGKVTFASDYNLCLLFEGVGKCDVKVH